MTGSGITIFSTTAKPSISDRICSLVALLLMFSIRITSLFSSMLSDVDACGPGTTILCLTVTNLHFVIKHTKKTAILSTPLIIA
jgi:hypothetical protein